MHEAWPVEPVGTRRCHQAGHLASHCGFHTEEGELFAIDDTCTHQDASLADGWVEGCEVECPLHASKFNLRTGGVDAPPAKLPVRVHEVIVQDGTIMVRESEEEPNLPPGVKVDGYA